MKKIFVFTIILLLAASCQKQVPNKNQQDNQASINQGKQASVTQDNNQNLPQGNKTGWETYTNARYGFIVQYPKTQFEVYTDYKKVKPLNYIPACDEKMVGCLFYSKDQQKGTNFESAGVSVNILPKLNTKSNCTSFDITGESSDLTYIQTINGIQFDVKEEGVAATGHFGKDTAYRYFHNGMCYEVRARIGYTNIANYPEGTVKKFNENEVLNQLKQVVSTFQFIVAPAYTIQTNGSGWSGNSYEYNGNKIYLSPKSGKESNEGYGEVHFVKNGKDSIITSNIIRDEPGGGIYPSFASTTNPAISLLVSRTGDLGGSYREYDFINAETGEIIKVTISNGEILTFQKNGLEYSMQPNFSQRCGRDTIKKSGDDVSLLGIGGTGIKGYFYPTPVSLMCIDPGGIGSWYDPSVYVEILGIDSSLSKLYFNLKYYQQDGSKLNLPQPVQLYFNFNDRTIKMGSSQNLFVDLREL